MELILFDRINNINLLNKIKKTLKDSIKRDHSIIKILKKNVTSIFQKNPVCPFCRNKLKPI